MGILKTYLMPHAPIFLDSIGDENVLLVRKTREAFKVIAEEIAVLQPDTIVLISPHGPIFTDAIALYDLEKYSGNLKAFGAMDSEFKCEKDSVLMDLIIKQSNADQMPFYALKDSEFKKFQYPNQLDHGVLVPLHFIWPNINQVKLIAMSYGTLSYDMLIKSGALINEVIDKSNQNVVVIASGDMSHALKDSGPYTYDSRGVSFDEKMINGIHRNRPFDVFLESRSDIDAAKECGLRSYAILLGTMMDNKIEGKVLAYEAPFGVGYLTASFALGTGVSVRELYNQYVINLAEQRLILAEKAHPFVKVAKHVIAQFIITGKTPHVHYNNSSIVVDDMSISYDINQLSGLTLSERRGVFVSIKTELGLRGCVGSIVGSKANLVLEIMHNAILAATRDARFDAIVEDELDALEISVDVLSVLEEVQETKGLNPDIYGIVVHSGHRQGLLLPCLDGINTVEDQVKIACNKAGFNVNKVEKIERFTVNRFQ